MTGFRNSSWSRDLPEIALQPPRAAFGSCSRAGSNVGCSVGVRSSVGASVLERSNVSGVDFIWKNLLTKYWNSNHTAALVGPWHRAHAAAL